MLIHLSIRNYALISHLEIDFDRGLTVITGETGAGKSILLGALSLILGQRADSQSLQSSNTKCIIEGIFEIKNYSLEDFFRKNNLDFDAKTILRREITVSGNSRAFINDTPVTLQQLKELGSCLVDIHSQHESLLLNSTHFQFNLLDAFAKQNETVTKYKTCFKEYQQLMAELLSLQENEQKAKLDKDYFQFQLDELEKANLRAGEQEGLEQEQEMQRHSEEIKKNIFECVQGLNQSEGSIVPALAAIKKQIISAAAHDFRLKEIEQRIQSVFVELEDIAAELEKKQDTVSFSPEKMEEISHRLDIIYSLQQKHRVKTIEELIAIKNNVHQKLASVDSLDEKIEKLKNKISALESLLLKMAGEISSGRKSNIPKVEKNVNGALKELGMPDAQLKIELTSRSENFNSALSFLLTTNGIDDVKFLFSANKGSVPKEIHKIASGGELSRVMLSIKSLLAAHTALPTVIFDEIDTGVSGEVADKMGFIMQRMAGEGDNKSKKNGMQVISITHLPQIASKGKEHFFVYKEKNMESVNTRIRKLTEKERIHEIARLLSGEELGKAAILNAKELLKV